MSGSRRTIDARGLPCPQPVALTKKALEEGGFETLEILVDSETAKDNVMRFSAYSGREAEALPAESGGSRILIRAAEGGSPATGEAAGERATVFLSSDAIGKGDEELGAVLMRGFVYALAEGAGKPERIVLMNSGVKLAAEGSAALPNLKRLADAGVDIVACGTCVEFYGLKGKLGTGRISNMYEIAERLLTGRIVAP